MIFGLGGVGGFCAEMLARAGVGTLTIIDFDKVAASNINRQIIALNSTIGQDKTALFESRLKDINPDVNITVINNFYTNKLNEFLLKTKPDFIADAIDTTRPKISLLHWAHKNNLPVISSFGAGNRIDPTKLYICDISEIKDKSSPFISGMIYQLKKKDIVTGIAVVASSEKPFTQEKLTAVETVQTQEGEQIEFTKITPASTPFVASTAGIFMASYIVKKLITT